MVAGSAWRPSPRYESFLVHENSNGTFHILVVAGDGGYIFADNINGKGEADWMAALLNAAIGVAPSQQEK